LNKLTFLLPFLVAGCAYVNEDMVAVKLESEPPGAIASIQGGTSCQTPCEEPLSPRHRFLVTFSKPGCHDKVILLEPRRAEGVDLGILPVAIVAQGNLDPNPAKVILQCDDISPTPGNALPVE